MKVAIHILQFSRDLRDRSLQIRGAEALQKLADLALHLEWRRRVRLNLARRDERRRVPF